LPASSSISASARIASSAANPPIVSGRAPSTPNSALFDCGREGDELYLAMEHVDGKDLRAVWNRCAKKGIAFPVDVAVYIARELARGLHHAHTAGSLKLVHRDVSPPNVLISFGGR
jgi:serine/threonine protein kinase